MPKRITPPKTGNSALSKEIHSRCAKKAGRAAGKNSPLTDGDIRFLSAFAIDRGSLIPAGMLCDEFGDFPNARPKDLSEEDCRQFAWIFFRDSGGAARALHAAKMEADRIEATAIRQIRSAIRNLAFKRTLPVERWRKAPFDVQAIAEAVSRQFGEVSVSNIKKALRLERDAASG